MNDSTQNEIHARGGARAPEKRTAARRPRLAPVALSRLPRGLVRVDAIAGGPSAELDAAEVPLLALLDGARTLPELVDEAARLPAALDARSVLSVLRRLDAAQLLDDLAEAPLSPSMSPVRAPTIAPAPRRRLPRRVVVPGTRWLFAPGTWIGARRAEALVAFATITAAAVLSEGIAAALFHRARWLLDPFALATTPGRAIVQMVATACAALSSRGLARGLALAAWLGEAPRAAVAFTAGLPHLDVDDAAKRTAPARTRSALALAGLAGIGAFAAACGAGALLASPRALATPAATALLVLLADACPYVRSDGYELLAIAARTPRLAGRSARWLVQRSLRNWLRRVPPTRAERRLAAVATAWTAHAVVAIAWLAWGPLRGALALARYALLRVAPGDDLGVALLLVTLGTCVAVLLGLAGSLAATVIGALAAAALEPGVARPSSERPARDVDLARLELALGEIPAIAALEASAWEAVVDVARVATFPAGAWLRKAGADESRLVAILSGHADVVALDDSGAARVVAPLEAGAWFGQAALLRPTDARTSVRARTELEAIVIDGARFRDAIAGRDGADRSRALLAAIALVRAHPGLASLDSAQAARLLARATVHAFDAGEDVALPAMRGAWLVREGAGAASWTDASGATGEATFVAGEHVRVPDGASARARFDEPTTLLHVDAPATLAELLQDEPPPAVQRLLVRAMPAGKAA